MSSEQKVAIYADSCRLCLVTNTGGINLTEDHNMLLLFEFCIGISIDLKYTPQKLCLKCTEDIKSYSKFKQDCLKSEELWKSIGKVTECNLDVYKEETMLEVKVETVNVENSELLPGNEKKYSDIQIPYRKNNYEISTTYIQKEENLGNDLNTFPQLNGKEKSIRENNDLYKINRHQCGKCKKIYRKHKWLLTHKMNVCYKIKHKKLNNKNDKKRANIENSNIEHFSVPSSPCGLCKIPYICDISEHMVDHWSNNDLECQLCDYCGRDFADMITHSYKHSPKTKMLCHVCKKKTASILSLQFHFRSIHLKKAGGVCTVCNKTFEKFKTWKRHERLHDERGLFICDHCQRKFLYKHEIKSHLINHTDVRQFVCETCGKGFKRMSALKDHIENVHSVRNPVQCDHCKKTYKSQTKLEIHLRNLTKERLFICEVCSKSFITERILQKHMFWHTGERPYSCEVCGSKYKAKGQLNLHMRKHTGFMPHKCVDCGKSFPAAKQLKRHQSIHTGVRAHKCLFCERSFHDKKALMDHVMQHKSCNTVKSET